MSRGRPSPRLGPAGHGPENGPESVMNEIPGGLGNNPMRRRQAATTLSLTFRMEICRCDICGSARQEGFSSRSNAAFSFPRPIMAGASTTLIIVIGGWIEEGLYARENGSEQDFGPLNGHC